MKRWVGNLHHEGNTSDNMDEKFKLYNRWKVKDEIWKFEITHSLYCAIFENSKALQFP